VESAPQAYRLKASNAASPISTFSGTIPVGKRPANCSGDLVGDAQCQRADVLGLDGKCKRPFLSKRTELLACFLDAALSLDPIWRCHARSHNFTILRRSRQKIPGPGFVAAPIAPSLHPSLRRCSEMRARSFRFTQVAHGNGVCGSGTCLESGTRIPIFRSLRLLGVSENERVMVV
jgi:hypothetical protein